MSVIGALKRSLTIIWDNPVILGVTFILALFGIPGVAMQGATPESELFMLPGILLYALLMILITPFFMAGILGMAGEARKTGATSFSTFTRESKRNYVRLLLGYILFMIIIMAIAMVSIFGGIFIGLMWNPIALLIAVGLAMILTLASSLFLQFFDVGIVLGDYGVIETFKKSFGFAKSKFVSVFGYSILRAFISIVFAIPTLVITMYPLIQNLQQITQPAVYTPPVLSPELIAAAAVSNLIFATLSGAILYTFHAVFYTEYALGVK